MKNIVDVSVSEVVTVGTEICKKLIDKGYNSATISLIGSYIQMAASLQVARGFSEYLLEEQVNL